MRKQTQILAAIFICVTAFSYAADIFVSPNGNDFNTGNEASPLQTLQMAQRKARELRRLNDPSIAHGINIILKGGTYPMVEPALFRPEDSGTLKSPTVITSAKGENAILSGGVGVSGWTKATDAITGLPNEAKGKVWVADVPRVGGQRVLFRQMWVNGKKAVKATSFNDGVLDRILSVDNKNEIIWIPKPKVAVKNIHQMEFVIHQWWAIANLRVKGMKPVGDSVAVTFHQPESKIEFEHPWPAPFIDAGDTLNGNSAFFFTNSIELLNSAGEWYEDFDNGKIYYWPLEGENLKKAEVVVPYLENIIQIQGNIDQPVSHIQFKNISVQHATWLRPSYQGHVPLQAGFYLIEAYKLLEPGTPDKAGLENQGWLGRQPAGIVARYANNLRFERCVIKHMAATGIDLEIATNNNVIEGCVVADIGGTGIQVGYFGDASFEAHKPYNPTDARILCHDEYIANNVVLDATNEDWGCVGIGVGFAHDITIEHNDISDLNYTGVSLGWGWTKTINCMKNNRVHANHIHHFAKMMYDVGGVYTLAAQPNSEISNNSIHHLLKAPYAHIPNHYQYIYYDEGFVVYPINKQLDRERQVFLKLSGPR